MFARIFPDKFIFALMATIAIASVLPAQGRTHEIVSDIANVAIFSLFFFHGLRLSRESVLQGLAHWRLQLALLAFSFALMPLLTVGLSSALPAMLTPELWIGVLFLGVLPSTVQSAISSSSMGGGNVAASVIASACSNLAAVILTPLVFALVSHLGSGESDMSAIGRIMSLLLLPFLLGQMMRRSWGRWAEKRKTLLAKLDRTTILITVYTSFSAAVVDGLWQRLDSAELVRLTILMALLLALGFTLAWIIGGALGLKREDRISFLFAGAHKSLATGAPMARILFPATSAGMIIIPLMIYHQLQLMVSPWIASALARRAQAQHHPDKTPAS